MRSRTILRAVIALVAGVSVVAPAGAAGAGHPEQVRPFFAEHDDTCTYTWTSGQLSWKAWHPPDTPGVNVWGEVGARQRPDCAYLVPVVAFADFTAYVRDRLVDHQLVKVGEKNPTEFRLTLEATSTSFATEIDRVEIRACLVSSVISPPLADWPEVPAAWCGKPDIHHRLGFVPTG